MSTTYLTHPYMNNTGSGIPPNSTVPITTGYSTYSTGAIVTTPAYIPITYDSTSASFSGKIITSDVEIDGVSVKEMLATIKDRLAILTPDPEKLEKFTALKNLYDQYKILEALCIIEKSDDKK